MTRSVRDVALMLDVMSGIDERDSTTADRPPTELAKTVERPIEGLRVGIPRQYMSDANDSEVNAAVNAAADAYRALGATIVSVELPLTDVGISTYYVIAPAEASSNLARYDGIRYGHRAQLQPGEDLFTLYARSRSEGFGPEVQRRIMLGTYMLSSGYYDAYYKRALQVRRRIKQEFDQAFSACDVLLGPTAPTPAFGFGANSDPLAMYLCDVYTVNTNIAGICGVSIPAGFANATGSNCRSACSYKRMRLRKIDCCARRGCWNARWLQQPAHMLRGGDYYCGRGIAPRRNISAAKAFANSSSRCASGKTPIFTTVVKSPLLTRSTVTVPS